MDAPSKEAAIFNAMAAIRADAPEMDRVRFLVSLPGTSPLWRHAHEIAVLLFGSSVEWPGLTDLPLMEAREGRFRTAQSGNAAAGNGTAPARDAASSA